jgi:biotin-dependent carboxylase-like uncharacterized protein
MTSLRIVEVGWGTTLQDRGRPGLADVGVPRAGAVDRHSHDLVNRLVGNAVDAATIETNRGLVVEAVEPAVVASSADGAVRTLRASERLHVDAAAGEMWAYLAVRGGIEVAPVLGSRSHDTLSGLGPDALAAGDLLAIGPDPGTEMPTDLAPHVLRRRAVRIWDGPQHEWFGSVDVMIADDWLVTSEVSRVGVRLERHRSPSADSSRSGTSRPVVHPGIVLDAARSQQIRSMPSEGLVEGAIQITPSGQPIVMLANHPTTGGYPVIAVVDPDDVAVVAQAPPGSAIRFRRA